MIRMAKNQMEAEEFLQLFDSCWFERAILTRKHEVSSPAAKFMHQRTDKSEESKISEAQKLRIRSLSDRCLGINIEAAPQRSVIIKPHLQKIASGKEVVEFSTEVTEQAQKAEITRIKRQCARREKGRRAMSRSLSALEFEELKGFMDLGFTFTEEDKNPGLISIIPGLQKWGKMADYDENSGEKVGISRPYLSEAWGVLNMRRGENNFLMNWKIPSVQNEITMKDHLRIWAHTVASTVR